MARVLAIDIGTASVSAVVAEKDQRGKLFVCNVFRYPYDSSDKEIGAVLVRNLDRAFLDVSKLYSDISKVFLGFSSPLYLEKTANAQFERANPEILISGCEFERNIESLKNKIGAMEHTISYDILETKVNGYLVENPLGYRGENFEIKANFLIISALLKNCIEDLKDKYFPAGEFKFFSDSSVIKKAILNLFPQSSEFLILDIGGEATAVGQGAIPFGLRKIERQINAPFLKRFSAGHLDYPHERAINKIMKSYCEDLRGAIKECRHNKIFLTGGGANFPHFFEFVKENGIAEVQTIKAEDFFKFFSKISPLSGGGDAVLTSLLAFHE